MISIPRFSQMSHPLDQQEDYATNSSDAILAYLKLILGQRKQSDCPKMRIF